MFAELVLQEGGAMGAQWYPKSHNMLYLYKHKCNYHRIHTNDASHQRLPPC